MANDKRSTICCAVITCRNTQHNSPEKKFISIPRGQKRKSWLDAINRSDNDLSLKSCLRICEDHFDVDKDFKNLNSPRWTTVGNIVPHKNLSYTSLPENGCYDGASTEDSSHQVTFEVVDPLLLDSGTQEIDPPVLQDKLDSHKRQLEILSKLEVKLFETATFISMEKKKFRSKQTQVTMLDVGNDVACSPLKISPLSPLKSQLAKKCLTPEREDEDSGDEGSEFSSNDASVASTSSYSPSGALCSSDDSDGSISDVSDSLGDCDKESGNSDSLRKKFQMKSRIRCRSLMEANPRLYLGIDQEYLSIISLISYKMKVNRNGLDPLDICYLVLRKIRLNESFEILAHEFGISRSHASHIFRVNLNFMAKHLEEMIIWPKFESIQKNLPVSFRKNYRNVNSIIDCLETEIEKPSSPRDQALTWSQYKKCNTLKYLIGITPDGLISFISNGYGGRATDEMVVSHSGYLEKLAPGMCIMADRGFKKVETHVLRKKCSFVRPPSVKEGVKLSRKQVITSRKIAGLRIHVERAISRIREFKFCSPHACIDHNMIKYCDDAMKITCGLINLRGPLIK